MNTTRRHGFLLALTLTAATSFGQVITNGDFENGLTGWQTNGFVNATTASDTSLFPSQGDGYAVLDASITGPVVAGHGPHPSTTDASQLSQVFTRPAGARFVLSLDWEFVLGESQLPESPPTPAQDQDFLSIDITDVSSNTLITNVLFIDNGIAAGTPAYTNVPGAGNGEIAFVPRPGSIGLAASGDWVAAPQGPKRAVVDLSNMTTVGSQYRLTITVANGGDDSSEDSVAFIDNIQFTVGQLNSFPATMQVLGGAHLDGLAPPLDTALSISPISPNEFLAGPGQSVAIRTASINVGQGWTLAVGQYRPIGGLTPGLGTLNINTTNPSPALVFNGLNPQTPTDALLGTISSTGVNFIEGQIPESMSSGDFTFQAGIANPASPPIFVTLTAATRVVVDLPNIPVGDVVINSGTGNPLQTNEWAGLLDAFNGAFEFYGVSYTLARVNANGNIIFGATDGSPDESANAFRQGPPRIAALWDSYFPDGQSAIRLTRDSDRFLVSWENIKRNVNDVHGTNVSAAIYSNGVITVWYGSSSRPEGLVGISPGSFPPLPSGSLPQWDVSSGNHAFGNRTNIAGTTVFYEWFGSGPAAGLRNDEMDIMTLGTPGPARITYAPNSSGTYDVFTGTR